MKNEPESACTPKPVGRRRPGHRPTTGVLALWSLVLGLSSLVAFPGCSLPIEAPKPDTTRYYTLGGPGVTTLQIVPVRVGLRLAEAPEYLRAKAMVVRVSGNEVKYVDDARWVEPLESAVMRGLRDRMAPNVSDVRVAPFAADYRPDFIVTVRIRHCEGATSGDSGVLFEASFEIARDDGTGEMQRGGYRAPPTEWSGRDFGALAAALTDAVNGLGGEIVKALGERREASTE